MENVPAVQEAPVFEVREEVNGKTMQSVSIRQLTDGKFLVRESLKDDATRDYSDEEHCFDTYLEVLQYLASIAS